MSFKQGCGWRLSGTQDGIGAVIDVYRSHVVAVLLCLDLAMLLYLEMQWPGED
jgi:hypothetical protein